MELPYRDVGMVSLSCRDVALALAYLMDTHHPKFKKHARVLHSLSEFQHVIHRTPS